MEGGQSDGGNAPASRAMAARSRATRYSHHQRGAAGDDGKKGYEEDEFDGAADDYEGEVESDGCADV